MAPCITTRTRTRVGARLPSKKGWRFGSGRSSSIYPTFAELEVQMATLNESVVNRVQRWYVALEPRFEALPDLELDGEVLTVGQFPAAPGRDGEDIRYFLGRVKIVKIAPGLTPGMSTRIDINLPRRDNVIAVPLESIRSAKGHKALLHRPRRGKPRGAPGRTWPGDDGNGRNHRRTPRG